MQTAGVPMVLFAAGAYRLALEARFVTGMADTPTAHRRVEASALLFQAPCSAPPVYWLTLSDAQGVWQLGVHQPVTLRSLAASELYPLPPLLLARRIHPALCGIAFEPPESRLLLDASKLWMHTHQGPA
ncbi:hypothetical protein B0H98_10688 [Vreelandella songnenensis]|uniref:CheW-like domain-containing protein n=1 Tax=Vreelandella songnenensis TaxID=1176243 RepID=A0A2T0V1Y2_9GAMM|nr:hypothetical protein [Halomonas songnenensis]PRY64176.1 hypothetical protein B0H98_10688 [Halomonas songnenensis]